MDRRLSFGLPVVWFLWAAILLALSWAGGPTDSRLPSLPAASYPFDVYVVDAHGHLTLPFTALFTVFGLALCAAAEVIARRRRAAGDAVLTSVKARLRGEAMKSLDDVGFVRYASVYRDFSRTEDFEKVIAEIDAKIARDPLDG